MATRLRGVRVETLTLVAVAIASANVLLLLVKLRGIVSLLYVNPDTASAPVIASLARFPSTAAAVVTLGNYPYYESALLMHATLHFPAHRAVWEDAPVVLTAASVGLLVRVVWSLFGRAVALTTAAIFMSVTPFQQYVYFTPVTHGLLLLHATVLVAVLAWLFARPGVPSWGLLIAFGVALAALTGLGLASDPLGYAAFLPSFVVAGYVGAWRLPSHTRVAAFALATTVGSVVWAHVISDYAHGAHWRYVRLPLRLEDPLSNVRVFAESFTNLGGGDFFGVHLSVGGVATVMAGALTLLALLAAVWWLCRELPNLQRLPAATRKEVAASAYLWFWAIVLVAVCFVFLITSAPQDASSGRYLANAFAGVAALIPALAWRRRRSARMLVAAGVCVFAVLALYDTAKEPTTAKPGSVVAPAVARRIRQFALSHGAKYGYARYYDAAPLAWESRLGIQVYPVFDCPSTPHTLCRFFLNTISSWYHPRKGDVRTFLVADRSGPYPATSDPSAGTPVATAGFGSVRVYVYDHDIAGTIKPPQAPTAKPGG